jgi:hypothetical protein
MLDDIRPTPCTPDSTRHDAPLPTLVLVHHKLPSDVNVSEFRHVPLPEASPATPLLRLEPKYHVAAGEDITKYSLNKLVVTHEHTR